MKYERSKEAIQTILDAARTQFVAKNYADVTVNDIVNQASVSKGAMYHHFSSKEDVYLKMMHHYLTEIQKTTQSAAENKTGSVRERLYRSTLSFLQLPEDLHGVLRLVRRDINIFKGSVRNELVRAYQAAVPEQVESIIQDGIESGKLSGANARILSWQLVALVEVVLHPYSKSLLGDVHQICDYVISMFFDGIATPNKFI